MNENQVTAKRISDNAENMPFDLVELLVALAKHKRLVFGLPVLAGVLAMALGFALPSVYKADTKILPPQPAQSGAAALLSQLGGVAGVAASAAGIKSPNDLYIGMLKSRTVADNLIKRFELKKAYETGSAEKARRVLTENTLIVAGKDGLISIEVEDHDKTRAPMLANAYVEELSKLTKVLAVTEASQRRVFFEQQLETAKNNLATAESTLRNALETHGVISVDSASRAIVETIGRMRAQISAKEIQLNAMQAFVTTNNQEYKRAQEEINSLRSELSKLENGRPASDADRTASSKPAGLENIKILRDVKYYEMLYELLSKQYEVARLDEAKDVAMIQVLDRAIEPERKFKPKPVLLAIIAAVLALFAAITWAMLVEARKKTLQDPANSAKWAQLKTLLQKW
jgi:uncharacterized protein involved in exopolysaccharide biosynthesis